MFWYGTFQGCEDFICKPKDFVLHVLLVPSSTIKYFKQIYDCENNHTNNNEIHKDDNQHHSTTDVTGHKISSNYETQFSSPITYPSRPILLQHPPSQPRYILLYPSTYDLIK